MSAQPDFDGQTYVCRLDRGRLTGQMEAVFAALSNGGWWTLAELAEETGHPEASVSARIRDLRKVKFGGYKVTERMKQAAQW